MTAFQEMSPYQELLRDSHRLEAIAHSGLLRQSLPDETFTRLTRLAARLLGTRTVLVSLLTEDRQVVVNEHGPSGVAAERREVPISHSLCQHVVGSGQALFIDDTGRNALACHHPGVLEHKVRAYAGVPIALADGRTLGTFCAIDSQPNAWSDAEIDSLRDLAAIAGAEIEVRVQAGEAKVARRAAGVAEARFRATFEQAAVGIAHVGLDGSWLHVNTRLCEVLGYTYDEMRALKLHDLTHPEDRSWDVAPVGRLLAGDIPWYQLEKCYRHRDGHGVWSRLTVSLMRDAAGQPTYFVKVIEDISERRRAAAALVTSEAELRAAQTDVLARLAQAAEVRDDDTGMHTRRVGELSARIANMLGLLPTQVALIREAAPLHDVGKIGVPDAILLKPGALTPSERERMQAHAALGARLLSGSTAPLIQMAEQIAHAHHERWDGAGYPRQLAGDAIPLEARIVAVADVFDALTSDRPYRTAWPVDRALQLLREEAGSHFDPAVVTAFEQVQASAMAMPVASRDTHLHGLSSSHQHTVQGAPGRMVSQHTSARTADKPIFPSVF